MIWKDWVGCPQPRPASPSGGSYASGTNSQSSPKAGTFLDWIGFGIPFGIDTEIHSIKQANQAITQFLREWKKWLNAVFSSPIRTKTGSIPQPRSKNNTKTNRKASSFMNWLTFGPSECAPKSPSNSKQIKKQGMENHQTQCSAAQSLLKRRCRQLHKRSTKSINQRRK